MRDVEAALNASATDFSSNSTPDDKTGMKVDNISLSLESADISLSKIQLF